MTTGCTAVSGNSTTPNLVAGKAERKTISFLELISQMSIPLIQPKEGWTTLS